jgi:hypothetical protein
MKISVLCQNAGGQAETALIDAGSPPGILKMFTGSAPSATTSADTGTHLCTLTFSNTSFGTFSAGVGTANTITSDTNAANTGTAGYFRIYNAAGTCIAQGTVGTSGSDINMNTTSIVAGGTVAITSMTWTQSTN